MAFFADGCKQLHTLVGFEGRGGFQRFQESLPSPTLLLSRRSQDVDQRNDSDVFLRNILSCFILRGVAVL